MFNYFSGILNQFAMVLFDYFDILGRVCSGDDFSQLMCANRGGDVQKRQTREE